MISGALESKEYSPGMRVIIRNEEWMIKKVENNSIGKKALYCKGISPLVKDREAIFLADLEKSLQKKLGLLLKVIAEHN